MGYWDELCAICGLSPGGGPYEIFANGCLEDCLDAIIESLAKQNLALDINESELRGEVRSILCLFKLEALEVPTAYEEATKSGSISSGSYFPFHSDQWDGWKAIAIGVFDDSFSDPEGLTKLSQGYAVTTRLVTHPTGNGGLFEGIEGQIGLLTTNASAYEGNLFCLRTPYLYLQSWVDRDSLPLRRTAFPFEPEMSFEGEFYEIIQFWEMGYRDDFGTLPGMCYGGIERTLDQFQDHFFSGFEGASELGRALQSGMRGNDLIPALLGDFKVWQTCPPDRWVKIDSFISSSHTQVLFSKAPTAVGHWSRLPTEVVFQIFLNMPIDGILAFVSTCSSLRHRYGNPIFLSRLLRSRMRRPFDDFHWFLPVLTVQGEVDKFCKAYAGSMSSDSKPVTPIPDGVSAVFEAEFPLLEFIHANYATDSMRNRRRLWKISQQFREEWHQYRTGGFKRFQQWRDTELQLEKFRGGTATN